MNRAQSLFPHERHLGLLTDLYELTMAAGYHAHGMSGRYATFELWARRLPACRNYLVVAGLEQVLHYLEHLSFAPAQIEYLRRHPAFADVSADWFDYLRAFKFTGDLWAIPEGTVVFGGEPLLRIRAPLDQAQIIETFLITSIAYQTIVASKAARIVTAARGRPIFDFGSRRAHGPQAGLLAARAAYIAGCIGTSNTEAGRVLDIPTLGTQAHSWIMAWGEEREAFVRYSQVFPQAATLLIDTYDTVQGVRNALASGAAMQGVRLDSGDLYRLSCEVGQILDQAGRRDVKIIASGDMNEYKIRDLLARGAPIDSFGVGTELVTSRDDPTLSIVYKLVEQETEQGTVGRLKLAAEKKSYPFAKHVYRQSHLDGTYARDVVARSEEPLSGDRLLILVLREGRRVCTEPTLAESRQRCTAQLARLPAALLELDPAAAPYPVLISPRLEQDAQQLASERSH